MVSGQLIRKMGDTMTKMVFLALVLGLAGCATVEGVGRDISGGARTVNGWIN